MDIHRCRFGTFSLISGATASGPPISGPQNYDEDAADAASFLATPSPHSEAPFQECRSSDIFAFSNPLGPQAMILGRGIHKEPLILIELREYPVFEGGRQSTATFLRILKGPQAPARCAGFMEHAFAAAGRFISRLGFQGAVYTSFYSKNAPLLRLAHLCGPRFPRLSDMGTLTRLQLDTDLAKDIPTLSAGYDLLRATPEDIPKIASLITARGGAWDLAPRLDVGACEALLSTWPEFSAQDFILLRYKGVAVGCVGVWDQRRVRQFLPLSSFTAPGSILNGLRLLFSPANESEKPAEPFLESAFLSFFILHPRHADAAGPLLRTALLLAREKGARSAFLGLSDTNTLLSHHVLPAIRTHLFLYRITFAGERGTRKAGSFSAQPELALL